MDIFVLDPGVLGIANMYRADMIAVNADSDNKARRHDVQTVRAVAPWPSRSRCKAGHSQLCGEEIKKLVSITGWPVYWISYHSPGLGACSFQHSPLDILLSTIKHFFSIQQLNNHFRDHVFLFGTVSRSMIYQLNLYRKHSATL